MKLSKNFIVKINLRKKKSLICCSYNPSKNKTLSHLHVISRALDDLSKYMIMSSYWVILTMNQKKKICQISKTLTL